MLGIRVRRLEPDEFDPLFRAFWFVVNNLRGAYRGNPRRTLLWLLLLGIVPAIPMNVALVMRWVVTRESWLPLVTLIMDTAAALSLSIQAFIWVTLVALMVSGPRSPTEAAR